MLNQQEQSDGEYPCKWVGFAEAHANGTLNDGKTKGHIPTTRRLAATELSFQGIDGNPSLEAFAMSP